jgi:dolichol-phosphate mannosyltransferase
VDDNSPDGTGALADALARDEPRIHVLHRSGKLGLGTAYVTGFAFALEREYTAAFEMDADFSHDPADLPRLLGAIDTADVAIGSRWTRGGGIENWSPLRVLISRGGSLYAKNILGLGVQDLTSGFKCFRRSALQALDLGALRSNGYAFQVEVNYACACAGLRLAEVPIIFRDRTRGTSKMSWRIVAEAARVVLQLRFGYAPLPLRVPAGGCARRIVTWPRLLRTGFRLRR